MAAISKVFIFVNLMGQAEKLSAFCKPHSHIIKNIAAQQLQFSSEKELKNMKTKENKYIAPNECSFLRWLGVLLVSQLFSMLLAIPLSPLV